MPRADIALILALGMLAGPSCRAQDQTERQTTATLPDSPGARRFGERFREMDRPDAAGPRSAYARPAITVLPERVSSAQRASSNSVRSIPGRWMLGDGVTRDQDLLPLTGGERVNLYLTGTYMDSGSYAKRLFSAGIDQARGEPDWGAGWPATVVDLRRTKASFSSRTASRRLGTRRLVMNRATIFAAVMDYGGVLNMRSSETS